MFHPIDARHSIFNDVGRDQVNISIHPDSFIDMLPCAKKAPWNYVDIDECLEGTRSSVLNQIKDWILSCRDQTHNVFWLNGLAGTGKSTVAKSIAHFVADEGLLGASFFCSRGTTDRSDVTLIFPTLAHQLSEVFPTYRARLVEIIQKKRHIGYALPFEQLQRLIIEPLKKTALHTQSIVIVIDALDECKDEKAPSTILTAFSKQIHEVPFLRVFVTSRPEPAVRQGFRLWQGRSNVLDLHLVDPKLVDDDIRSFLTIRLTEIAKGRSVEDLPTTWPPAELVERLVEKASGLFIFASTLCSFIDSRGDLQENIEKVARLHTSDYEGRQGIDRLYGEIIKSATAHILDDYMHDCRSILGTIILLQNPISLADLSHILHLTRGHVTGLLTGFHSVLAIPRSQDQTGVVHTIHASFHDFMVNENRCLDTRLLVQPAVQHGEITMCLFGCMTTGFQSDIHAVEFLAKGREQIHDPLAYASRYWADHLCYASQDGSEVNKLVAALDNIVRTKLIYWIGTLNLLGSIGVTTIALQKARRWHSGVSQPWPTLTELLKDGLAVAILTRFTCIRLHETVMPLEVDKLQPVIDPRQHGLLDNLTSLISTRFHQPGLSVDVDEVAALVRKELGLQPAGNANGSTSFTNLAGALSELFDLTGQSVHLDESIALHREALGLLPAPHPDRWSSLNNLAYALNTRFGQTGQRADLDESIALHREALGLLSATHTDRSYSLNNLANSLASLFDRTGQHVGLDEAIALHREALGLLPAPHPDRSSALNNLANTLGARFGHTGQDIDLDEAIALHLEALGLLPAPHPDRWSSLNNLAYALNKRFGRTGRRADLDDSIGLHREALGLLPAPHPDRSNSLNNLAYALGARFDQIGLCADLDEAIALHREALGLRHAPHPDRSTSLNNLAYALETRFGQMGQRVDLDESIALHREALGLRPAPHPDRWSSLNNLANALNTHFCQTGQCADLDESIALHREALGLLPAPHPDRSMSLNNLAYALETRFGETGLRVELDAFNMHSNQTGQHADLDESIVLHREALGLLPAPHPDRWSSLNNLAYALNMRFGQRGHHLDLDESIALHQEALGLLSINHPGRRSLLNNLACTLGTRFSQIGQHIDLKELITLHQEGLGLSHAGLSMAPSNFVSTFRTRFSQTGQHVHLDGGYVLHPLTQPLGGTFLVSERETKPASPQDDHHDISISPLVFGTADNAHPLMSNADENAVGINASPERKQMGLFDHNCQDNRGKDSHQTLCGPHLDVVKSKNFPPDVDVPMLDVIRTEPITSGKRKALLIGISYRKEGSHLPLCTPHRDVSELKKLLIEKYGYQEKDIVMMLDGTSDDSLEPNRANILREIEALVKDAQPGDRFLFHYSGHSCQIINEDGTAEHGLDEVLIPSDDKDLDKVILDVDLRKLLVDSLPFGSNLVAVFDCCHSASMLDLEHHRCNRVYTPWVFNGERRRPDKKRVGIVRRLAIDEKSQARLKLGISSRGPSLHVYENGRVVMSKITSLDFQPASQQMPESRSLSSESEEIWFDALSTQASKAASSSMMSETYNDALHSPIPRSPIAWLPCNTAGVPSPTGSGANSPDRLRDSPVEMFCSGSCLRRCSCLPSLGEAPHVICVSSCTENQVFWEDGTGRSMTMAMIGFLRENPHPPLEDLMKSISHYVYGLAVNRHEGIRRLKKKICEASMASSEDRALWAEFVDGGYDIEYFQDPQVSSLSPLDMNATFTL